MRIVMMETSIPTLLEELVELTADFQDVVMLSLTSPSVRNVMMEPITHQPEDVFQTVDSAVDQDSQLLEHLSNAITDPPMLTLMVLAVPTVLSQDVVITSSIAQEVRSVIHQDQDVQPTVNSLAETESSMLENTAIWEQPMMISFQTTAELLAPTSLVVMVLEIGMRLATLELKTPMDQMHLAEVTVFFLLVVMVLLIQTMKNVMMETTLAVISALPLANGNVVTDTETQLLRNAIGELTMDSMLIHADQEDSSSMVLTWDAHSHSVVMVSSMLESNAITEETTAIHQMLADQIVLSHTVVMVLEIPTMVNGVILVTLMMTSLETVLRLVFQMNAEQSFHQLEDTSTSLASSEESNHQSSSTSDLSLVLLVLRMLPIMF